MAGRGFEAHTLAQSARAAATETMMIKLHTHLIFIAVSVLALALAADPSTLVDDSFADGNSQNQDLANNSLRVFNGRANTVRTGTRRAVSVIG